MPIAASDLQFRLSGGAANANPNLSLGGAISATAVVDGGLHNLFDAVSAAEGAAGDTEYRCLYVRNGHATLTLENAVVYVSANTASSYTDAALGLGSAAVGGVEPAVGDESTAPAGVAFAAATGAGAALPLGSLGPGQHKALWLRRNVSAGAPATASDTCTLRVEGDTAP